jgi:hypothetical protein
MVVTTINASGQIDRALRQHFLVPAVPQRPRTDEALLRHCSGVTVAGPASLAIGDSTTPATTKPGSSTPVSRYV